MNAPCQALIVEDDADQLATIVSVVRDVHLEPLPARNPDQALNKLIYHQPVLAVLDLDVAGEGEARSSIDDVLLRLYQYFGGCFVTVFSARADDVHQRRKVHAIHPLATFVSKKEGDKALSHRIHQMMNGRIGDLTIRMGMTYHVPTGRTHQHRVGVSLLLGATLGQEVVLDDTDAKAARRMDAWLRRVGSQVRVVDQGRRCYALYVTEERERAAPEPQAHEASA